jgi:AcrR family transcriptional regulator
VLKHIQMIPGGGRALARIVSTGYGVSIALTGVATSTKESNPSSAQGRPRDPSVDQAVLRAALELFIEHGIAGASIEKIAKRAGVAKTSIYRRWSNREALIVQAIEVARNATGYTIDLLERTSPRDFIKLLVESCEVIATPEIRKLMARLIGSAPDYPKLIEVYRETYYLPRRLAFVRALERAQTAGLLAKNSDLETLADMLIGALMHRLLMFSPGENSVSEFRDHMIKLLRQAGFDVSEVRPLTE